MAGNTLSLSAISLSYSQSFNTKRNKASSSIPSSSMYGNKLLIRLRLNSTHSVQNYRSSATATVSLSLPTLKPDRASSEKIPNWSARAIKAFAMAELEARKIKYPNTGTEALLMGILVEGTSTTAKFLRDNGIMLFKVREETINLLGKSDLYYFSPEHPPLTEQAQRVLDWAIDEKLKSAGYFCGVLDRLKSFDLKKSPSTGGESLVSKRGKYCMRNGESGEITTTHLLLGIWSEKESAGHKILASLGFNDEKAKELAKSMNKDAVLSFK